MAPRHTKIEDQLDTLNWNGVDARSQRKLNAGTATTELVIDVEAQVDIAAGGGADGALNVEHQHRLVKKIRVYDGSTTPIVEIEPRELIQLGQRRAQQQPSGTVLANPGIQAATQLRQQYTIPLSDRWAVNPAEVFLKPSGPIEQFLIEIEWADVTNAGLAAALITGGTRVITITNLKAKILQVHDPVLALRAPLFVPRIAGYEVGPVVTGTEFEAEIKTPSSRWVRNVLLHTLDNDVTTEAIINRLSLETDQGLLRKGVFARTWHEQEQYRYGGVGDEAGVSLGYFFADFADNGRLSNVLAPRQGGRQRWKFDVTGSATRKIRAVQVELARIAGVTSDELPPGLAA